MSLRWLLQRVLTPAIAVAAFGTSATFAATLSFDGSVDDSAFVLTDAQLVSGNCAGTGPDQCIALNNNATTTITADGGGTFSALSFWFQFLGNGNGNTLLVESSTGGSVSLDALIFGTNDGGQVFNLPSSGFTDIMSLTFSSSGGGNVRIDDITLSDVSPVPLPASGLLLLGTFAVMAGAARRRRRV